MPLTHEPTNASDNQTPQGGIGDEPKEKLGFQRSLNLIVVGTVGLFFTAMIIFIIAGVAYEMIFN